MPMLLSRPSKPFRTVAKLYGYHDANREDDELWYALRRRAADLGADALVFVRRVIVPCVDGGSSGYYVYTVGGRTYGGGGSKQSTVIECTVIEAAGVLIGEYDCEEEQDCRTDREDALVLDAPRHNLGEDLAPSTTALGDGAVAETSSVSRGREGE